MPNTLFIHKTGENKFWHTHNGIDLNKFAISDFEISIDGVKFNIIQNDGAVRFTYNIADITIQVLSGAIETFINPVTFYNRLVEIGYTPFYVVNNGTIIHNGQNTTVTGDGSVATPYQINTNPSSGRPIKVIVQGVTPVYPIDANDKYKSLILTGDADMELVFTGLTFADGDELEITKMCDGDITFTGAGAIYGNTAFPLGSTMFMKRALDLWIINYRLQ